MPLDSLPTWPYERVDMPRYFHRHYLGNRVGTHHSSYGCPFACSFCAVVGIANRRWVAESPARVGALLERFKTQYGADAVQFHDMDFFISEPRTQAIADRLVPLGMSWWALGRVDELMRYRTATWELMKRSGLRMVFCGAESGSTDTLSRMNKGGTAAAELTLDLARRMKSFGIVPEFSFVVGNPPPLPVQLVATVGPKNTISLQRAGKKVTTLTAGAYVITVRDRSKKHNFHLLGPGLNRKTTVRGRGTTTWNLTLGAGKFSFRSDPQAKRLKGSFTVTA